MSFFIEKVRNGIQNVAANLTVCSRIMTSKNCRLSLKHVSVEKVRKLLKNLKNTKSSGVDELDNFCVKISANIIAQPLHHIITLSILENKFKTSWKYAKVVPLHKKGCSLERINYRPVAILSPLGKVLEKIVYEQLYSYFTSNKLFHPNLHGYRQNRSTQTALLQMYDRLVQAAHEGHVTGVVLLDLSAAFGSNLGPLFFLIYYNDLPFSLQCEIDAYADDSTMSATDMDVGKIGNTLTEQVQAEC